MRLLCIALLLVSVSCKHEAFTDTAGTLQFDLPAYLYTSDSVLLGNEGVQWTLSPNIGRVTAQQYYKAPSSLFSDSQQVVITAKSAAQAVSKIIIVVKKDPDDTVISFSKTIMPLMTGNCNFSGCHGNGSKAGKTDLSSYESTLKSVVPYQPTQSLLYLSMIKTDPLRRMPPAGAMHAYRIRYFSNWIEQGALNN